MLKQLGALLFLFLVTNVEARLIEVIPDLEGSLQKFEQFVKHSKVVQVERSPTHDIVGASLIGDGKLVFLGDSIDKGPDNIKVLRLLVSLKEHFPSQVVLIMGNRDINKLRLNFELEDRALNLTGVGRDRLDRFRLFHWASEFEAWKKDPHRCALDGSPAEYKNGSDPSVDRILKMKFLFERTLGAPDALESIKKELGFSTDQQVYLYYRDLLQPDGLIGRYLSMAELIHLDEQTGSLFVHGGISPESYGVVPETSLGRGDQKTIQDLRHWITELNAWGHSQVSAGLAGKNYPEVLPLIQYQEPRIVYHHDEQGVSRPTWDGALPNPISVVHGRPWSDQYNLNPLDKSTEQKLMSSGVNKLFFGHSPIGQIPVLMKSESGFLSVACDTSVTTPQRVGTIAIHSSVHVFATYVEKREGSAEVTLPFEYDSSDAVTGSKEVHSDGSYFWLIQNRLDQRVLKGTWTQAGKAPFALPRYEW